MISEIKTLDVLNDACYYQFLDQDPIINETKTDITLYPFDLSVAVSVINGDYQYLRSYQANYKQFLLDNSHHTQSSETFRIMELYSSYSKDIPVYLYPNSKKEFLDTYFSNFLPSVSHALFDLMKSTGRLTQIGAGQGKALVIKPLLFTESHLNILPSFSSPSELISSLLSNVELLSSTVSDMDYLIDQINKRDEIIFSLRKEIVQLNAKINQAYQTTWR